MDIIIAKQSGEEIAFWDMERDLDLELGDSNDFEFLMSLHEWENQRLIHGMQVFIPDTEYGGIIGDIQSLTDSEDISITGDTWRGMMTKKIIEPPDGEDYKIVSGEPNAIMKELIEPLLPNLFYVSSESTGIYIENFQFDRYCTLLSGIEKMLNSIGCHISIKYMQGPPGGTGRVEVAAVPVTDYSEDLEYSQDNKVSFKCRDYRRGINHLICLGKGQLKDRLVIHLFVQQDGSIGRTQYYSGLDEKTAVYDFSSEEDDTKLEESGTEKLRELMNYKEFRARVEDVELNIGDIVAGRDYITGIYVRKPIINKILRIKGNTETVEYKLKGDD